MCRHYSEVQCPVETPVGYDMQIGWSDLFPCSPGSFFLQIWWFPLSLQFLATRPPAANVPVQTSLGTAPPRRRSKGESLGGFVGLSSVPRHVWII